MGLQACVVTFVGCEMTSFKSVVAEMRACNPQLKTRGLFTRGASFNADGSIQDWNLHSLGIRVLPDSIGELRILGVLDLGLNELESLPEGFSGLTVGGNLVLEGN